MSTKTNTKSAAVNPPASAIIGGGNPIIPDNIAPTGTGSAKAASFFDIVGSMNSSSRLDSAAIEYVEKIQKIFDDGRDGITSVPLSTSKVEARAFIHDASKNCINIIFAESNQSLDKTPVALRTLDVYNAAKAYDGSLNIIQTIAVTKEDYALAGNMAAHISNCFKSLGTGVAANITVDKLKDLEIGVVTNIDAVRDYVRKVSPHAVPSRDDYGILLCLERPVTGLNGYREVEQIPFMAITGYTRIMNPQDAQTGTKFVPIPTITDIVTSLTNPNLLAMALPLAADAFICQSLWCRPYLQLTTGKPNLGNLILDGSTKKPFFINNPDEFHTFLRTYMVNPFLAVDVTEGRARPLFIDTLIDKPNVILNGIANFFGRTYNDIVGVNEQNPNPEIRIMEFSNYTGTYVDKGQIKDTRCVDYLDLATKVTNHREIAHLLLQSNRPQDRIEAVRNIYNEATKPLYLTTTVVLDAAIIMRIIGYLNQTIRKHYDIASDGNLNITSLLMSRGNNFDAFGGNNTGFIRQNFSAGTFGNLYSGLV